MKAAKSFQVAGKNQPRAGKVAGKAAEKNAFTASEILSNCSLNWNLCPDARSIVG